MLGIFELDEVKIEMSLVICVGILFFIEENDGEEILMLVMLVMFSNQYSVGRLFFDGFEKSSDCWVEFLFFGNVFIVVIWGLF